MPATTGSDRSWLLAVLVCAAAASFAASRAVKERQITDFAAASDAPTEVPQGRAADSPRVLAAEAVRLARRAAALPPGNERSAGFRAAEASVAAAIARRPAWGDAHVAHAYVAAMAGGATSAEAIAALDASYRRAPFLRDAAEWRISFAVAAWDALTPTTRAAVEREAILLSRLSRKKALHVRVLTAGTPLYAAYARKVWPDDYRRRDTPPRAR